MSNPKANTPLVYPETEDERQALELQHSLRDYINTDPGFYSEKNKESWLKVLHTARSLNKQKEPTMTTWTCLCNNINPISGNVCLKCQTPKVPQEALEALKCQNTAAKAASSWVPPLTPEEFTRHPDRKVYLTAFYNSARKPLQDQIQALQESLDKATSMAYKAEKELQDLRTALFNNTHFLNNKPKVGDFVWCLPFDTTDLKMAKRTEVINTYSDRFYGEEDFGLPRSYNDLNVTWFWSKP